MLGPYNTTVSPLLLLLVKRLLLLFFPCMHHIVIVVPLHCYHYIGFDYIVLLYISKRSYHLYHPRIVHLCKVKEVPPRRG